MPNRHWRERSSRFDARLIGACVLAAVPAAAAVDERQQQVGEWRLACATGDGAACYALGEAYEVRNDLWGRPTKGAGVRRDDAQAHHYYRLSCAHGFGEGCFRLARMDEQGRGGSKNAAKAAKAYGEACRLIGGEACQKTHGAPAPASPPKLRP